MQDSMHKMLPELSFTIKRGDDSQTGDFSLDCIGFGIHQCWIYATMFGATTLFNHQNMFDGAFEARFSLQFLVSIAFLTVTLLFYAFTERQLHDKIPPKLSVVVGAAMTFVGSILLITPDLTYEMASALEIVSGILTGIGSAALIISWGVRFSRRDLFSIALNSIGGVALAYFLYSFVLASLPAPAGGIVTSILPLLELPVLLSPPQEGFFTDSYSKHFKPLSVHVGKFLLSFGVPMLIFGLAMGLLRHLCIQHAADLSATGSMTAIVLAIAILLARVLLFPSREGSWGLDFRGLVPLIAVAIAFIPSVTSADSEISNILILVTYLCFETLMWTYFGEISQAFRISPLLVYGLGRGLAACGTLIASGLIVEMRYGLAASVSGEESLVLFLILTLIVAFTLLPNKNSFQNIVAFGSKKKIPTVNDFDKPDSFGMGESGKPAPAKNEDGFEHDLTLTSQERIPAAAAATAAPTTAAAEKAEPVIVTLPAEKPATVAVAATVPTATAVGQVMPALGPTVSSSVETLQAPRIVPPARPAAMPLAHQHPTARTAPETPSSRSTVQTARFPMETSAQDAARQRIAVPQSSKVAEAANQPEEPKRQRKGWFRKKCEAVSNLYMLSAREEEVLFYLAKGFNAGHIQEKLYISEGTAKTHMRHIYRKLDVHSQQALIRLVESMEIEEDF